MVLLTRAIIINAAIYKHGPTYKSAGVFCRFDNISKLREELIGDCSIDDSMIETQPKRADLSNCDRVVDHHRTFFDHPDTQDRILRLVDDRSSCPIVE